MPFSGVRISCDTMARKRDLAPLAASAASRASASARSASMWSLTSRTTLWTSATRPSRPDHDVAPGEPTRAVNGHDLLVMHGVPSGSTLVRPCCSDGSVSVAPSSVSRAAPIKAQ